jgi:hypothetical protein
MLSIIVCSRNKNLPEDFIDNILKTVGVVYEIISIDNSENQYSIFSAYNIGFTKSKYSYICFVHEDVFFHSINWGEKVIEHLQNPNTGIIGLAGAGIVTRVPASWKNLLSLSENIIQSDRTGNKATKINRLPLNYNQSERPVIILDGVFMCMRRELMEKIHFDESLKGFHGYDFDISIQSTVKGYVNNVIYDIELEHFSRGKTDKAYFRNLITIFKKWEFYLPLFLNNSSKIEPSEISGNEKSNLYRLIKKMVRKGFKSNEIIAEASYFADITAYKKTVRNLEIRIFIIRLFNCPKYLFIL